MRSENKAATVG